MACKGEICTDTQGGLGGMAHVMLINYLSEHCVQSSHLCDKGGTVQACHDILVLAA